MAHPSFHQLFSENLFKLFKHDPNATSAQIVTPDGGTTKQLLAAKGYGRFACAVLNYVSAAASGPTLVELVGCTDAAGSNPTQLATSGVIASVTVGDMIFLETSIEHLAYLGDLNSLSLTHVSARITCSNSGDECAVWLGLFNAAHQILNLTANSIG